MTPNKEDYLKCIYELHVQNEKVTNKLIAQMMQVSAPAVTEMLRKLLQQQLIIKSTESGYDLTKDGLIQVTNLVRKHRLIEVFLLQKMGYDHEQVHDEAEILEHCVSDLFIEKLDALLNFPTHCPHGNPIPKANSILNEQLIALTQAQPDKQYVIVRMSQNDAIKDYFAQKQLTLQVTLTFIEKDPFSKLVTFSINNHAISLSEAIAAHIFVQPIID